MRIAAETLAAVGAAEIAGAGSVQVYVPGAGPEGPASPVQLPAPIATASRASPGASGKPESENRTVAAVNRSAAMGSNEATSEDVNA